MAQFSFIVTRAMRRLDISEGGSSWSYAPLAASLIDSSRPAMDLAISSRRRPASFFCPWLRSRPSGLSATCFGTAFARFGLRAPSCYSIGQLTRTQFALQGIHGSILGRNKPFIIHPDAAPKCDVANGWWPSNPKAGQQLWNLGTDLDSLWAMLT